MSTPIHRVDHRTCTAYRVASFCHEFCRYARECKRDNPRNEPPKKIAKEWKDE